MRGILKYWGNKEPKCPHCDYDIEISEHELYELYEEGEREIECPECENKVVVDTMVSYTFTTTKTDEYD